MHKLNHFKGIHHVPSVSAPLCFSLKATQANDLSASNKWYKSAQEKLKRLKSNQVFGAPVKNIIFFLGDGMGVSTLTAARYLEQTITDIKTFAICRILKGQKLNKTGVGEPEESLTFEQFPNSALIKTYCSDHIVADSACSATAYLSGVKVMTSSIHTLMISRTLGQQRHGGSD